MESPAPEGKPTKGKGANKKEDKEGKNGKKSQRPSWSCTECTRRKIRCDRVVPGCNQCIKRNKVHLCRLDQDLQLSQATSSTSATGANPSITPAEVRYASTSEYDAILRSVGVVRQRLNQLDRIVQAFVPQRGRLDENNEQSWAIDVNRITNGEGGGGGDDQSVSYSHHAGPSSYYNGGGGGAGGGGGGGGSETPSLDPTPAGGATLPLPAAFAAHAMETYEQQQLQHQQQLNGYSVAGALGQEQQYEGGRPLPESDGEVEAAVTLEFLALGRDRKPEHFSRAELRRPSPDENEATSPALATADQNSSAFFSTYEAPVPSATPATATAALPSQHPSPAVPLPPDLFSLNDLLPDVETSGPLIEFSLERVAWQHAAVHSGQFRAECREFFSWEGARAQRVNQAWLALYFAMLCSGTKHMCPEDAVEFEAPEVFRSPSDYVKALPKLYFDAAVEALHRSNFLSKHSIFSIQAIVVLGYSCADVGGSDQISTLWACAIRIGQHLGLHRFSGDQEWEAKRRANGVEPTSEQGVKGLIQREIRKRLWHALSIEDWLQIPTRQAYAIDPAFVTTPPPLNCTDEDLSTGIPLHRSIDEPTIVSKLLIGFQVANCIRIFFNHVNSMKSGSEASYEKLLEADRELRRIIDTGPAFLKVGNELDASMPGFVRWYRRYWIMSVSHKLLIVHRVFLGKSFRDSKYSYSRKSAIEAARSIIQELVRGKHLPYQDVWTVPYHTLTAATTILLDIFNTPSSDPDIANKRHEVQLALEELILLDSEGNSQIAARGVRLLTTLLAEEAKHRRSTGGFDARKRKASEVDGGEGFGELAKRVVSNSRTPLSSSTTLPVGTPAFPFMSPSLGVSTFPYFAPTAGSSAQPFQLPPFSTSTAAGPPPPVDKSSPVGSHISDTNSLSLSFDTILQNLAGWSAPLDGSSTSLDFGGGGGGHGMGGGMGGVGGGVGEVGGGAFFGAGNTDELSGDWWRLLDSNLEPSGFDASTSSLGLDGMGGGGSGLGGDGSAPW